MNVISVNGKTVKVKGDNLSIMQSNGKLTINGVSVKLDDSKKVQIFSVKHGKITEED